MTITAFKRKAYEDARESFIQERQELNDQRSSLIDERSKFQAEKQRFKDEKEKYEKQIELKYKNQSIERFNQEITKTNGELIAIGIILITLMALAIITNRSVFENIGQDISVILTIGSDIWGTIIGIFALSITAIGFWGIFYFRNQAPSIIEFALRLSVVTFILSMSAIIGIDTAASSIEVFALFCASVRWWLR